MISNFELRKKLDESIERDEIARDRIIDKIGVWGPMIIPMVPAGLTFAAIGVNYNNLLHFPLWASWPIGLIAGSGIEVFGIIANENYLDMQRFNQTLQEGEESAPVEEARKARDTYVKIVVGLMVTLEVIPSLIKVLDGPQIYATVSVLLSLFPLVYLAVLTGQVIIMRKQHRSRVRLRHDRQSQAEAKGANDKEIQRLSNEIQTLFKTLESERLAKEEANHLANDLREKTFQLEKELAVANARQPIVVTGVSEPVSGQISAEDRRIKVLKMLSETSEKSEVNFAEWGRMFDTSDTTIRNDLKWLIKQGYWRNGDTWKIQPEGEDLLK